MNVDRKFSEKKKAEHLALKLNPAGLVSSINRSMKRKKGNTENPQPQLYFNSAVAGSCYSTLPKGVVDGIDERNDSDVPCGLVVQC